MLLSLKTLFNSLIKINLAKINLSSFMAIKFRFRVMVDAFNKPVKI